METKENILLPNYFSEQIADKEKTRSKSYSEEISAKLNSQFYDGPEILSERIAKQKEFLTNERWTNSIFISARIIKIDKENVDCECLISKSESILEIRKFPRILFEHLNIDREYYPVKIKLSFKKGSIRTDIIDGRNLNIEDEFETIVMWDKLIDFPNDEI